MLPSEETQEMQDEQKAKIRSEKMAFVKRTVLGFLIVVPLLSAIVYFFLKPEFEHARKIERVAKPEVVQTAPVATETKDSALVSAVNQKMTEMQSDIEALTATVKGIATQAGVMPPIPKATSGVQNLLNLLSTVQTLAATEEGAQMLSLSVKKLRIIVDNSQFTDGDSLNAALTLARTQDTTVAALLSRIEDHYLGAATFLLAIEDLRRCLASGRPFSDPLLLAMAVGGGDPAVKTILNALVPYSGTGIATVQMLQRQLEVLKPALLEAQNKEQRKGQDPLTAKALETMSPFLKVRKKGQVDLILEQAQSSLAAENVGSAIEAMHTLPGASANIAASWQTAADGHVLAGRAVDMLSRIVTNSLSAAAQQSQFSISDMINTFKAASLTEGGQGLLSLPGDVPYMSPAMTDRAQSGPQLPNFEP